jgi:hypothetical protein
VTISATYPPELTEINAILDGKTLEMQWQMISVVVARFALLAGDTHADAERIAGNMHRHVLEIIAMWREGEE